MILPCILQHIAQDLYTKGANMLVVGGAVRDYFLQLPSKDYDIEVYGLKTIEELIELLSVYGSVNMVGKSFGVLKFAYDEEVYDFSFPRTETKIAKGHRGFDVEIDGSLDFATAAKRRDFTMNAMGYDIEKKVFIDPFGGLEDMKAKRLRYIDKDTFAEDPLRVYRAVQFSARFGYTLTEDTFMLCKKMLDKGMLNELPKERIYGEFKKLLLKAPQPSVGFECMRKLGIVKRYFPELHALIGIPQSPRWHPEGDVWIHTMMALDVMASELRTGKRALAMSDRQKLKFLFAILCHDLGKAVSTIIEEKNGEIMIHSVGHENTGVELTKKLMYRLIDEHDFIESLLPLIEHHLKPSLFYASKSGSKAIRKLATKVNIEELVMVAKADFLGRTTEEAFRGEYIAGEWLLEKASELKVKTKPLEPLLKGRDLIALGMKPSPFFQTLLDEVYALQLEESIVSKEDAVDFVKEKYLF